MNMKWVRASDGAIAGVCKGIAQNLEMSVGAMRFIWLLASIISFGLMVGIYILFWIALPPAHRTETAMEPRILGVCVRLAQRLEMDVGLVRFLMLVFLLASCGVTLIAYVILHLALEQKNTKIV